MKIWGIVKEKVVPPQQYKAVGFFVSGQVLDKIVYKPFETLLEDILKRKTLSEKEKGRFHWLMRRLQKGKGYDAETSETIQKELPVLVERVCNNKATEEDYKNVLLLKDFLFYLKEQEKLQILRSKKMI